MRRALTWAVVMTVYLGCGFMVFTVSPLAGDSFWGMFAVCVLASVAIGVARRFDGRDRSEGRGSPLPVLGTQNGGWSVHLDGTPDGVERMSIVHYLMESRGVGWIFAKDAAYSESFPVVILTDASSEGADALARDLREHGASVSVHQG